MFKAAAIFSSLLLSAGIAGILSFAQPAMASAGEGDISTPAWTNHPLPLYTDGMWRGEIVGTLPGGLRVHVDACHRLWCRVHGEFGHGWVFLYSLSFGEGPNSIWWPQWVRRPGGYHPFQKFVDY